MAKKVLKRDVDRASREWGIAQARYGENNLETQRKMGVFYDLKIAWEKQTSKKWGKF